MPPYILSVKIDTTVIDKLINPERVSLMISVIYSDGVNEPTLGTTANCLLNRENFKIPNDNISKDTNSFLKS